MFPELGAADQESAVPGSRKLVVGKYVLEYEIDTYGVNITSISYGSRIEPVDEKEDNFDFEDNCTVGPRM